MPVPTYDPLIFGDGGGVLNNHAHAASENLVAPATSTLEATLVGDVATLLGHAVGGADTLSGNAGSRESLIGDALQMSGMSRGGADHIAAAANVLAYAVGDALRMSGQSTGGADTVDAQAFYENAYAYGDAVNMSDGARGGDDHVSGGSFIGNAFLYGDAETMGGSTVGGADTMTSSTHATMYGDAETLSGFARGGDDLLIAKSLAPISGSHGGTNYLYGDGERLLDYAHGGADTLVGGQGMDIMWGDAAVVAGHAVRGADLFIFAAPNGPDEIMDFQPGVDRIELQGTGISGYQALTSHFQTTPDGLEINFDASDNIVLAGIQASQLSARDFLFV